MAWNWNIGVIATAKRIKETARAVHCVIALTGAVAEPGGAEVASTIESADVRGAWGRLKVDRRVDGLYVETAGDHVAWCVEGSNAALTAPEINSHIGIAVCHEGVRLRDDERTREIAPQLLRHARAFLPCEVHVDRNE